MTAPTASALAAARQHLEQGRWEAADLLIDDVLSTAPGHVDALVLRGTLLLSRGAQAEAFALFSDLALRHPDHPDIAAHLGLLHRLEEREEEARVCFARAVALAPQDAGHRAGFAALLVSLGDLAAARAEVEALFRLGQDQGSAAVIAEACSLAGRLAALDNRPTEAMRHLRQALALRPDAVEDRALLCDMLARLDERAEALALAEGLYQESPTDLGRALLLARRLLEARRLDEAERHLRRIIAASPAHPDANEALCECRLLRGDGAPALAAFAALLQRAPEDAGLLRRMARLVRLSGDLGRALIFAQEAARRAPEDAAALSLRDELLLALGRVSEVWPDQGAPPAPPSSLSIPEGLPAGMALMLARLARRCVPPGGRLLCHAEPALVPLLRGVSGLAVTDAPAEAAAVPLPALLPLLGVSPDDLGAPPYLAAEAGRHAAWAQAFAHYPRPLIGLSFGDGREAPTLDALAGPLREALGGRGTLISLAFDAGRADLPTSPDIVDAGAAFQDARDLIAAIAHLDLIVGGDGTALHVAGALARPGIVLVPPFLPWAFAPEDGRALWYPTVRVLRAARPGAWEDAVAALCVGVRELA